MSDWLVRCDPGTGRFAAETSGKVGSAEAGGRSAVVAGDIEATEAMSLLRSPEPPRAAAAAAIWDGTASTLTLLRDATGLYPLFYGRTPDGTLVAGTDPRAVLAAGVPPEPDPVALAAWIAEISLEPERTLHRALERVPAGHALVVRPDGARLERRYRPPRPGDLPASDAGKLGEALEEAVARALRPGRAAVFLSGGVDSASVAAAAASVARSAGCELPVALSLIVEGASEEETQRRVAAELGLEQRWARVGAGEGLLMRALARCADTFWPVGSAWAPVYDDLAREAAAGGVTTVLDGQGGDDLLDATLRAARPLLRARRLGALVSLARAERRFTGASRRRVLRSLAGALRAPRATAPVLPGWLLPERPELRAELAERALAETSDYAAARAADLADPLLAAQREGAHALGRAHGLAYRHPFWDPAVVELLHGLGPEALVAGGHPKSPARAFLRERVPGIVGPWPRPTVADDLLSDLLAQEGPAAWRANGGPRALAELGVVAPDLDPETLPTGVYFTILCLSYWCNLGSARGEKQTWGRRWERE